MSSPGKRMSPGCVILSSVKIFEVACIDATQHIGWDEVGVKLQLHVKQNITPWGHNYTPGPESKL